MKPLLDLIARHKAGEAVGQYSVCSAHPLVLEAALRLEIAKQYPDVHLNPGYQFDTGENKWALGVGLTLLFRAEWLALLGCLDYLRRDSDRAARRRATSPS